MKDNQCCEKCAGVPLAGQSFEELPLKLSCEVCPCHEPIEDTLKRVHEQIGGAVKRLGSEQKDTEWVEDAIKSLSPAVANGSVRVTVSVEKLRTTLLSITEKAVASERARIAGIFDVEMRDIREGGALTPTGETIMAVLEEIKADLLTDNSL